MPVRVGLPVRFGPLLPSIRSPTNQRTDPVMRKIFSGNTAIRQSFSEWDVNMISATDLEQTPNTAMRRAVVTLPPKRRSKFTGETATAAAVPVPATGFSRHPRMKRTGQMSLHWRNGSDEQQLGTIRISPEILSAFNKAIGALGSPSVKRAAHAAA